jgi:hypothetical protein
VLRGDVVGVAAVPEPETYALMLAGLLSIAGIARRRRQRHDPLPAPAQAAVL